MAEWEQSEIFAELDAYADWAKKYLRRFDEPGWRVPVVIRLKENTKAAEFRETVEGIERLMQSGPGGEECLCMPTWYESGSGDPQHLSALVTGAFFDMLAGHDTLRHLVEQIVVGQRLNAAAVNHHPESHLALPSGRPEKGTVVVGIIDDAIAFAHERFRLVDKALNRQAPRVEYAWMQDLASNIPWASETVPYGREFDKGAIDRLLHAHTRAGVVDEDGLYRAAGLIDFSRPGPKAAAWRVAHGTHVMDLACGYAPDEAEKKQTEGQDRPIVCVQLPAAVTADTSGAGLAPYVLDGIRYILDRADDIARNRGCGRLPVVINFSYGFQAGPHDGTHPIELAIDDLIRGRPKTAPLAVVVPAGNSHLARCHAEVSFQKKGEEAILDWRILPDDETSSYLEVWLPYTPHTGESRVAISIAPPGRPFGPALAEGAKESQQALEWKPNGEVLCKVSYERVPSSSRGRFLIAVRPTGSANANTVGAPSGVWQVKLIDGPTPTDQFLHSNETVHLWIQRDDTPHGYPVRGRQSYFEDPDYERFDPQGRVVTVDNDRSRVRRAGSVSAIATGRHSVVVGGLVAKAPESVGYPAGSVLKDNTAPAKYSAGGPITPQNGARQPNRLGPDVVAVSDDTEIHAAVLAAGSRSGSAVAMNGTSVAAPQAARRLADLYAAGIGGGGVPATALSRAGQTLIGRPNGSPPALPAAGPGQPRRELVGAGPIEAPSSRFPARYWP